MIQLLLGDCLEIMPILEPQSIDAVITDLPYGTTACKWDEVIPFAPMWEQVKRVLKPRGVFVTTASQPFTSALVMSNREWFRYEWIWEKPLATGYLNANRAPMKSHENIAVFSPNGHSYYPQKIRGIPYCATSGAVGDAIRDKTVGGYVTENSGDRYPRSVLNFNGVVENLHPTQKPVALYEYLILTYTNSGDTVLDIAAGSGTTGEAAHKTGRDAILIEKDPGYFATMQERLERIQAQPLLFDAA